FIEEAYRVVDETSTEPPIYTWQISCQLCFEIASLPLPITQCLYCKQHLCNRRVRTSQDVVSYVFVIRVGYDFRVMRSIIIAEHQARRLLIVVAITEPLKRSSSAENSFAHFEQSLVSKT